MIERIGLSCHRFSAHPEASLLVRCRRVCGVIADRLVASTLAVILIPALVAVLIAGGTAILLIAAISFLGGSDSGSSGGGGGDWLKATFEPFADRVWRGLEPRGALGFSRVASTRSPQRGISET
jgi:hypothetical protein